MVAFMALAPVTIITLLYGQNGLLVSALVVGGMRLMGQRPIVGGVLLGLATIKPQISVLIGVAATVIVTLCFRRGIDDMSIDALRVGTFLVTPYVFRYDTPMLANAVFLYARRREVG